MLLCLYLRIAGNIRCGALGCPSAVRGNSAILLPLYMIRHTNASFLALRCISAIIFPGPIVLSQVTRNTRHTYTGTLKHVSMVTSLVWFRQGLWFGGVISNASVWTLSDMFFVSAAILGSLFMVLLVAFVVNGGKASSRNSGRRALVLLRVKDPMIH